VPFESKQSPGRCRARESLAAKAIIGSSAWRASASATKRSPDLPTVRDGLAVGAIVGLLRGGGRFGRDAILRGGALAPMRMIGVTQAGSRVRLRPRCRK
jgi:hypothetical protein